MKTYYLFKIATTLSRFVPPKLGYWLASLIGGLVFYFSPGTRAAIMDNMTHVLPGAPARKHRAIVRKVIRNQLKNYYDLVRLPHLSAEDVRKMIPRIEGLEHLEAAVAGGRGVVIFGGHIGNFSIVAQIGVILGHRMAIVAEDIKPEKLYDFVNDLRGRFGLEMMRMGSAEVRTIFKYLREGGTLMLAADRDLTDAGVPIPFFDGYCDLPAGPVVLPTRLKAPLLPCHTWRMPDNTSVLTIYPPLELQRTGDHDADVEANLRKVASVLEDMIRKTPDQWVVLQRVWDKDYTGLEVEATPFTRLAPEPALAEK